MPDLLIELFSEEIPARMQANAAAGLKAMITNGLVEAGLTYASAGAFSTPRRLALSVEGLTAESPTTCEERKGPRTDAPERALEGFLRSTGLTRDQLEAREAGKGEVWFATITKPGRPAAEIVANVLESTIRTFPWPKSMRWGAGSLRWVRPLHSILCILTAEDGVSIVPLTIDGLTAGDTTLGHRFYSRRAIKVASFDDYAAKLQTAHVILNTETRASQIWHDTTTIAFAQGLEVVEDKALLAEVAGLVEWPVVLMGEIGKDFLGLPPEVLQTSMREHQKFFSVRNPKTGRIEKFVTVANTQTADHGATILQGNQKVLAARLSDAKFFWENDLRTVKEIGLEGMAKPLAHVTFHNKLGSQADRIQRIEALAREIAPLVGAKPDLAAEAARIAKADLTSQMVGEFPELQGIMGRYYAELAGHDDGVPQACAEHYSPLGPSDAVPTAPVSVAVALADKIDTLTGFWAINEKPTGSKDPFALRRAALGVIRLILENGIRSNLAHSFLASATFDHMAGLGSLYALVKELNQQAELLKQFGEPSKPTTFDEMRRLVEELQKREADVVKYEYRKAELEQAFGKAEADANDLLAFLHDRLKVYLRDRGIRYDVIDACIAMPNNDDLTLLVKRAEALSETLKTDDGENLLQGSKRANNILTQAEEKDGVEYSYGADVKFAETPEEKSLFAALDRAEAKIDPAMKAEDFTAAMSAMATLRGPLDAFFQAVQVNTDNQIIRRNRLNLLNRIRALCLSVADLTKIEG